MESTTPGASTDGKFYGGMAMKASKRTRFLSLVLTLVLSFSLYPAALADLNPGDYPDVEEGHWAYESIMDC